MKEYNQAPIQAWPAQDESFAKEMRTEVEKMNLYRYDIFKGIEQADGLILKVRSLGVASIRDGSGTYIIQLRTFPGLRFYLLPNREKSVRDSDYAILTREDSRREDRKFFWSVVGEGFLLKNSNRDLLQLKWDLFGEEVYMNIKPYKVIDVSSRGSSEVA